MPSMLHVDVGLLLLNLQPPWENQALLSERQGIKIVYADKQIIFKQWCFEMRMSFIEFYIFCIYTVEL